MKPPYTCLVIDDEKPAQRIIENYMTKLPGLFSPIYCDSAVEAIALLHQNSFSLIFLDINMPELSGLDLLKSLEVPPRVILTTAYSQYALEGYDFGVIDYLLKPFSFQRFLKAVNRFLELSRLAPMTADEMPKELPDQDQTIQIRTDKGDEPISLSNILFIQAYGNYIKVSCINNTILVRDTLQNMLARLPQPRFVQVHRSYIVHAMHISAMRSHFVVIDNHVIPIGNHFRDQIPRF